MERPLFLPATLLDRLEGVVKPQQGQHGQLRDNLPLIDRLSDNKLKRRRSRSASPDLGINMRKTSTLNSLKRPKLYSRISERESAPSRLPLDDSILSTNLTLKERIELCDSPHSTNFAKRSKKPRVSDEGLEPMETESYKPPLVERIELERNMTRSSTSISKKFEDSFERGQGPQIPRTPSTGSNDRNWKGTSFLGRSEKTRPTPPLLTLDVPKPGVSSTSSPKTIPSLLRRLNSPPSRRSEFHPRNGQTSSRGIPSISTSSSPPSTSFTLLKRALGAWDQLKSPLRSKNQPNESKQPQNGIRPGISLPAPTLSSSPTEQTNYENTATTSTVSSLPGSLPPPTKSSCSTKRSGISSVVVNKSDSPTLPGSLESSTPSYHQTVLKRQAVFKESPLRRVQGPDVPPFATSSTGKEDVRSQMGNVGSSTSVDLAEGRDMDRTRARIEQEMKREWVPKYRRWTVWGTPSPLRAHAWTTIAKPLPAPPPSVLSDPIVTSTVVNNPDLFAIVTPVKVDLLKRLLHSHPNQPFVSSLVRSLRDGFWPYANIPNDYPSTVNLSNPPPKDPKQAQFLRDQRDVELSMGRYSRGFHGLMPGMYAMPLHAVAKDNGESLRLVTNHSKEPFSLNSMVDKDAMGKVPLDGMKIFGEDMLEMRRRNPGRRLVAWKSDVAAAYRLIPMHPYWQIKQAEIIDFVTYLNRCNVFGGTASQALFIAFMACIVWIAVHIYHIEFLSEYSDDLFGLAVEGDETWYEPYQQSMPSPQVRLLTLWDELGIPHKKKKQVWGSPLTIIGILVDPNDMSLTMPEDAKQELLAQLELWCDKKSHLARRGGTLQVWQQFAGWLNWAFNIFPYAKPCLSNFYAKIKGKKPNQTLKIRPNNTIREDLEWGRDLIKASPGVLLLESTHWLPSEATHVIYCDASLHGMGFYVENERLGFNSPTVDTAGEEFIFFHESLCILAAMEWLDEYDSMPQNVLFYCDNTNTVDMYNSLSALPRVNPILKRFISLITASQHDFKVLYIPGPENRIADALSRFDIDKACRLAPGLRVQSFTPPRITLGPRA